MLFQSSFNPIRFFASAYAYNSCHFPVQIEWNRFSNGTFIEELCLENNWIINGKSRSIIFSFSVAEIIAFNNPQEILLEFNH